MTPLDKAVVRKSSVQKNGRNVIVTLAPDNTVRLRLQGLRKDEVKIGISDLLRDYSGAHTTGVSIPARTR